MKVASREVDIFTSQFVFAQTQKFITAHPTGHIEAFYVPFADALPSESNIEASYVPFADALRSESNIEAFYVPFADELPSKGHIGNFYISKRDFSMILQLLVVGHHYFRWLPFSWSEVSTHTPKKSLFKRKM